MEDSSAENMEAQLRRFQRGTILETVLKTFLVIFFKECHLPFSKKPYKIELKNFLTNFFDNLNETKLKHFGLISLREDVSS